MVNKLLNILKVIISFARYFFGYLLILFISKYQLIEYIGEREVGVSKIFVILGTVGLIVKTIISLMLDIETHETMLIEKIKGNSN